MKMFGDRPDQASHLMTEFHFWLAGILEFRVYEFRFDIIIFEASAVICDLCK
jgi:hypothetical protein